MNAATPGPWAVSKRKARRVINTHGVVICNAVLRNSGSPKNGIKHGAKAEHEAEANAALIAAAPALRDALQLVADTYSFDPSIDSSIWQTVFAAIALATPHPRMENVR